MDGLKYSVEDDIGNFGMSLINCFTTHHARAVFMEHKVRYIPALGQVVGFVLLMGAGLVKTASDRDSGGRNAVIFCPRAFTITASIPCLLN